MVGAPSCADSCSQFGALATAAQCSRSVLPRVAYHPEFLLIVGLHLVAYGLFCAGLIHPRARLEWDDVMALSVMTVFFEAVYVNQSYLAYSKITSLLRSTMGAAYDFVFTARLHIRPCGQPYDRVAGRFIVVSLLFFLVDAQSAEKDGERDWTSLLELGLVKDDEVDILQNFNGPQQLLTMVQAACESAARGLVEAGAAPAASREVMNNLLKFRDSLNELQDTLDTPMPLAYRHLATIMVLATTALWGYCMAFNTSVLSPLLFILLAVLVLGLLELSSELQGPFKQSTVGLTVQHVAKEFIQNINAMLEYNHAGAESGYERDMMDESTARTKFVFDMSEVEEFFGVTRETKTMPLQDASVQEPLAGTR